MFLCKKTLLEKCSVMRTSWNLTACHLWSFHFRFYRSYCILNSHESAGISKICFEIHSPSSSQNHIPQHIAFFRGENIWWTREQLWMRAPIFLTTRVGKKFYLWLKFVYMAYNYPLWKKVTWCVFKWKCKNAEISTYFHDARSSFSLLFKTF